MRPTGMRAFTIIWLGQVISLVGSAMTWFAFTVWVWQKTGQATSLSLVSFFTYLPTVLFTPFAGVLVDRWDRKTVMLMSDSASALATLMALLLFTADRLEIWHVYLIGILAGFFTAFQYPAYAAAVTTMLDKENYTRAEAMIGLAGALSGILAPVFAAALLPLVGMANIMTIDLASFAFAFGTLLWVRIPQPPTSDVGQQSRGNFWSETLFGFSYIRQRRSLRSLTALFMVSNVFLAIGATLMAPLVLGATGNDESAWATVQSIGAVGGVVGGIVLTLWGGPKRRIHGVLLGGMGASLFGITWLGLGASIAMWAVGSFFFSFFEPFVQGGNMSLWQSKVEADVQGRIFSARHLLVQIPFLLGMLVSGPLAEYVLEPFLQNALPPGRFASGMGTSALLVISGIAGFAAFLAGYLVRSIRAVDELLPDLNHLKEHES